MYTSEESSMQLANARAQLENIKRQFAEFQKSLAQLEETLNASPKPSEPPYNEEQGIGRPKPGVIEGRRPPLTGHK